jgi:hypothetical protein
MRKEAIAPQGVEGNGKCEAGIINFDTLLWRQLSKRTGILRAA